MLPFLGVPTQGFTSDQLTAFCSQAVDAAVAHFASKKVLPDQIGIAFAALDRPGTAYAAGNYKGDVEMYPASTVKLFYLTYAAELLRRKKIQLTPEFERGIHDMIVDSTNDATALVVDTITDTTGGPELPPAELKAWMAKRQAVNKWFANLGYKGMNACQKTWNEGPYGRERQGYGPKFELRNSLCPNTALRLMTDIALDKIVSPEQCAFMQKYLSRKTPAEGETDNYQAKSFSGKVLPKGAKLWSKAGWTDTVRHDIAWIQGADGREFVMAIFTKGQSDTTDLIPFIAEQLLKSVGEPTNPDVSFPETLMPGS